jgi:hypothetical protein
MLSSEHKTPSNCPKFSLCCMLLTVYVYIPLSYLVYPPEFQVITKLSLPEGRAGSAWKPPEQQTSLTHAFVVTSLSVHTPFFFYFVAVYKHGDPLLDSLHVTRSWPTSIPPPPQKKIFVHTKVRNVSNKYN